jgi:hypothetical protein
MRSTRPRPARSGPTWRGDKDEPDARHGRKSVGIPPRRPAGIPAGDVLLGVSFVRGPWAADAIRPGFARPEASQRTTTTDKRYCPAYDHRIPARSLECARKPESPSVGCSPSTDSRALRRPVLKEHPMRPPIPCPRLRSWCGVSLRLAGFLARVYRSCPRGTAFQAVGEEHGQDARATRRPTTSRPLNRRLTKH